ncbi:UNVERIFIED_CONTAM: hypothetical protein NCL1_17005 [Trichonephila clavipes]
MTGYHWNTQNALINTSQSNSIKLTWIFHEISPNTNALFPPHPTQIRALKMSGRCLIYAVEADKNELQKKL